MVIEEEIDAYGLTNPPYYDSGGRLGGASILVWGSQEQKESFLPPIFTGAVRTWQLLSEPEAGSDLANVKATAIRDGDEYVINGQKIFVGSSLGCDYMWTITVTDPEGKRHENLGWFMIPSGLPGITVQPMDLLISGGESGAGSGVKNTVFFDNVRLPAFNLIGGENQGWKVATTHLELEHGTGGRIGRNWLVDRLFEHCRNNARRGEPMTKDPDVRDRLVDVYIEAEIVRLLNLRNYWMRHSGANITYEGPQASYMRKTSGLRMAGAMLDILGPAGLTYDSELGAADGHMEAHARAGIVAIHPRRHHRHSESHYGPAHRHRPRGPGEGRRFVLIPGPRPQNSTTLREQHGSVPHSGTGNAEVGGTPFGPAGIPQGNAATDRLARRDNALGAVGPVGRHGLDGHL